MRRLGLLFVMLVGLGACAEVVQPHPPTTEAAVKVPAPSVLPAASRAPRQVARDFIAVTASVEPVAEQMCRSQSIGRNCDFRILVDDRPGVPPNAFQTVDDAGRPIVILTLPLLADTRNVDEIAFVMAHETAHHIAGHLDRQRRNATLGAAVFGELASALGGTGADSVQTAQQLGAIVGARTYSKEFELEADRLGTIIAARAGFDPVRGAEFFWRIPDPGDQFLGSHPANAERIAMVRRTAAGL